MGIKPETGNFSPKPQQKQGNIGKLKVFRKLIADLKGFEFSKVLTF